MPIATVISLLISVALVGCGYKRLRGTTLTTAAAWSIAGLSVALGVQAAELLLPATHSGWLDLGWYGASVLLLCPGIAVLGARRPNAQVWAMFVLIPLVLVLMWPAAASTRVVRAGVPLELEEPAIIGFGLVLIMSSGNYFGTRYTLPIMLYAAAQVLIVAPMSATVPDVFPDRELARLLASMSLCLATVVATIRSHARPDASIDPFNRLWIDFVDSFGLVWAKRVMDRVNESARHEKWTKHLDWHGFVPNGSITDADGDSRTAERIEHTFRWLLKRFVEPEWIDSRLNESQ